MYSSRGRDVPLWKLEMLEIFLLGFCYSHTAWRPESFFMASQSQNKIAKDMLFITFIYLYKLMNICACVCVSDVYISMYMPQYTSRCLRTTCRNQVSLAPWVSEVIRPGDQHLYMPSHLAGPVAHFLVFTDGSGFWMPELLLLFLRALVLPTLKITLARLVNCGMCLQEKKFWKLVLRAGLLSFEMALIF